MDGCATIHKKGQFFRRGRGTHSGFRASMLRNKNFRERFENYRSRRNTLSDITALEHTDWAAEVEMSTLDRSILQAEEAALNSRIKLATVPRIGSLPTIRPPGVWRLMYCQVNCLGLSANNNQKAQQIANLIAAHDIDAALLCEVGVDWHFGHRKSSIHDYFNPILDRECKTTMSFNEHSPHVSRAQQGGTAILLTHSLVEYSRLCDHDFRRLGRWSSWLLSHNPHHRTRLVVAYCPGKAKPKGPKTVYQQHMNYIHQQRCDSTTPYDLFVKDLMSQLRRWRSSGDRIILCMDLNEHILRGPIARRLSKEDIELTEIGNRYWPPNSEPNTHIDGSQPIDGFFSTPDIDTTNFLSLSFHEGVGDHRTMIIEVTTASTIGRFQGNIIRPSSRRLTLRQHGTAASYNKLLSAHLSTHNISERIRTLREEVHCSPRPLPMHLTSRCSNLHMQIGQLRLHAERRCRKIARPALEFSPPVQYWYDRAHAYNVLLRIKSGEHQHIDVSRAVRMAHRKGIPHPRTLTAEQCRDGLAACKLRQAGLRKLAPGLRQQFVGEQLLRAQQRGDTIREKSIKERMQIERSRNLWKRINRVTKTSTGRACLEVQVMSGTTTITYNSKTAIEQAIQTECLSRFHLAHSAPIATTLLGYELQYLNNIDIAYAILRGEYNPPHYLDDATKLILKEIGKLGTSVLHNNDSRFRLNGEDYIRYWSKISENTSSSPSGIHIAHYKASAQCPELADIFANQMNLIMESGVHPLRWGCALQVMLEKIAGVCMVDKLRSIQLYEADLNWYMKFIFNDMALEKLNESGLLPEEHYSQKGSTAEDACLDKTLTLDISRQSRQPMALISIDAAQCYDRVHPTLMSLVWLTLVDNPQVVILLLTVLQQMRIFTRTGYGDSETFFGGPDSDPTLCGLGQGSKAAPASWLQLSSMIVNAYKTLDRSSTIIDPVSGKRIDSIGCLFVDDTDLYVMRPEVQTIPQVIRHAQSSVDIWRMLLAATGGAIKGPKSFWYLISYVCLNGIWEYVTTFEPSPNIVLHSPSGTQPLALKAVSAAERTLGVYHSPIGGHQHHLQLLHKKGIEWVMKIKNGNLPSSLVWMSYFHQLWPGLRYGLGILTNSSTTADEYLRSMEIKLLPLLGVNRNINKEWRTLPYAFGGVGLLSLSTEQLISRLQLFLQHNGEPTIIGTKIQCSLHYLQLQLGTNQHPFSLDYSKWGFLAPLSWLTALWESLSKHPDIQVHTPLITIPLPRQHDVLIMCLFQQYTSCQETLLRLNRCRCHLNVLFLSDMVLADGKTVDPAMASLSPLPRTSTYKFPPERPTRTDWVEWSYFWKSMFGRFYQLPLPLGNILHNSHLIWSCYYDQGTDTIMETSSEGDQEFFIRPSSGRTTRSGTCYVKATHTVTLSDQPLLPASCLRVRPTRSSGSEPRRTLTCTGPPPRCQSNPTRRTFWDDLLAQGGEWMWTSFQFNGDDTFDWLTSAYCAGSLLWVTDGSYNSKIAPEVSGAGWIVHDTVSGKEWRCSFTEISPAASSYRAELLGLYSIHVFIGTLCHHFSLITTSKTKLRCDNTMALRYISRNHKRIRANTKCADILRAMQFLHRNNNFQIHYGHVKAHMDDSVAWDALTLEQQLNVQCDLLAKEAVSRVAQRMCHGITDFDVPSQFLPGEHSAILINAIKQTSDSGPAIRLQLGRAAAKTFFCQKRGWTAEQFEEVDWASLHKTLEGKPPGYRIWLTKQHSNFCASGVQMKRWFGQSDDRCPNCLTPAERADHLCRCPNEERTALLRDSTAELEKWMAKSENTHHEILYWVPKYILCRGTVPFADLGPMSPRMMEVARSQDLIGWRNFMEGRISKHFGTLQRAYICSSETRLSVHSWTRHFISHILHITHSQWLFRNFAIHDSSAGLLRTNEREHTAARIAGLMETRPSQIPSDSRFLLEFDTDGLLKSDMDTQHYWIAAVEAALSSRNNNTSRPTRPSRRSLGVAETIRQIREDATSRIVEQGWVHRESSITGFSFGRHRPLHEASQLHHGSRKKHKPD